MRITLILITILISFSLFAEKVLIIKSKNISTYDALVTGFSIKTKAKIEVISLKKNSNTKKILNKIKSDSDLVFAIGDKALKLALKQNKVPIIFAMVLNYRRYNLDINKVTGIKIKLSAKTQIGAIASMFKAETIGIVSSSPAIDNLIEKHKKIASLFGIKLKTIAVEYGNLLSALGKHKDDIDALWMLPDKSILNLKGYNILSKFALQYKKPLYVLSKGLVEKGGLLSLSPNYLLVGKQAARIANKVLFNNVPIKYIPISDPDSFTLTLNYTILQRLNMLKEIAPKILSFAASKNL
jgi:ABC-type uncharacterized transport system substrate-binding protein